MQKFISLEPRGEMSTAWWVGVAAVCFMTVTTVVGNVGVLLALRRVQRAPSHYPLASLACADLLVGILMQPLAGSIELIGFHLDGLICSCWNALDVLCCTASIMSICLLGWERWCGITAPLARAKRARQARLYACLVWPVAITVALPTVFIASYKANLPGEVPKACSANINVGYVMYSVILSFYIPAGVMLCLYARILRALSAVPAIRAHRGHSPVPDITTVKEFQRDLYKLAAPIQENKGQIKAEKELKISIDNIVKLPQLSSSKKLTLPESKETGTHGGIISRQRRATRTIVILMALFLFCWTPFFVMLPIDSLCDCIRDSSWQWCTWLGYANSALNPIVYASSSPAIGQAIQASLTSSCARTGDQNEDLSKSQIQLVKSCRKNYKTDYAEISTSRIV